jgi:hypothetical protein
LELSSPIESVHRPTLYLSPDEPSTASSIWACCWACSSKDLRPVKAKERRILHDGGVSQMLAKLVNFCEGKTSC